MFNAILLSTLLSINPTEQISLYNYIREVSEVKGIDPYLVESILEIENPQLDENYININKNGTIDIGLWQLNSRYIWTDFVPKYWISEEKFNPFDWKHSTYLAISHISWLYESFYNNEKTVLAYNCGISAVKKNKIPDSSKNYAKIIIKNYKKKQKAFYSNY